MTDTPQAPAAVDRSGTPLVEMRDISIAFGGVKAVDRVSVDLYPGEVVGLLGHNGAGKSTLIKCLSGAYQMDSGEILVTVLGAASTPTGEILQLVRAADADVAAQADDENATDVTYSEKETARLFAVNCARCHGVKGDGEGPDSRQLGVKVPDMTSPAFHATRTDEELHAVIAEGGAAVGMSPMMPPWGTFLSEQEIEHLVRYIRSLPEKHHRH